jgi:hypothetical protein
MITYLLANGGTNPTINFRTWNGNATSGSWSAPTTIVARASINATAIASSDIGALSAFTFGEASIDTDQLFGTADCRSFGSVYLKSRASDTDNTAGKDLIAPEPVSVTNCGTVLVKKTDNAANPGLLANATFKIEKGKVVAGVENSEDTIPASSRAGFYCIGDIKLDSAASTHKVTETAAPTGYDLPNPAFQNITVSSTQLCADRLAATIPDANVQVDVTFVDTPQLGAIKIVKQAKDKNCANASSSSGSTLLKCTATATVALLSGAAFQICTNPGPYDTTPCTVAGTATTSSAADSTFGTACVGSLPSGTGTTYYVHETGSGSTNFGADATDQSVTLTGNSTCPSPGAGNTKTFTDKPLSKIQVKFFSSAGTGVTVATITCKKPDSSTITPDAGGTTGADQSYSNLPYNASSSEHYTCEVNIDP